MFVSAGRRSARTLANGSIACRPGYDVHWTISLIVLGVVDRRRERLSFRARMTMASNEQFEIIAI